MPKMTIKSWRTGAVLYEAEAASIAELLKLAVKDHAALRSANLRGADLSSANLRSAALSGAALSSANLRSAALSGADLSGADLSSADLSGADLRSAALSGANLRSADLSGADLRSANLRSANLRSAALSSANLRSADLSGADLSSADLSGADLSGADLSGADLSGAKGMPDSLSWFRANFKACKRGVIVYKTFGMYQTPPESWKVEPGAVLTENCNANPHNDCGCGINFATLDWIKNEARMERKGLDIWMCLIRWSWLPGVVIPWVTTGKARCAKLQLIRKVGTTE